MAQPYRTVRIISVVIEDAASLSSEFDFGGQKLIGIEVPAGIDLPTSQFLSFQAASGPGGTMLDVYDDAGFEVTIPVAAARFVGLDAFANELGFLRHGKVRAGTSAAPQSQTGPVTIKLHVEGD